MLLLEIIAHACPRLGAQTHWLRYVTRAYTNCNTNCNTNIEQYTHVHSGAHGLQQKQQNWNTLQHKVLCKLSIRLHPADITAICRAQPGAVEQVR